MNVFLVSRPILLRKAFCALLASINDVRVVADGDSVPDNAQLLERLDVEMLLIDSLNSVLDLATASRVLQCFPRVKILFLWDDADEDFEVRAIRVGARGCVSKSSDPQVLERALRVAARGELWVGRRASTRVIDDLVQRESRDEQEVPKLTQREYEVLGLLAQGCANKEIAARLFVSDHTVKTHLVTIYKKLKVDSRLGAVMYYFHLSNNGRPKRPTLGEPSIYGAETGGGRKTEAGAATEASRRDLPQVGSTSF
jgi:DNA-binding NarL/FixJ family response regulator